MATSPPIIGTGTPRDFDLEPHDLPVLTDTTATNVLVQISQAIGSYPEDFVELEFIDVVIDGGEEVLNTGEEADFRLRVRNTGPLTMRDVTIKLVAKNGAKVKGGEILSTFASEVLTRTIDTIAGHNADNLVETELLHFKAPAGVKPAGTDLVEAYIESWKADLAHPLNAHSVASSVPNGVFESEVEALND